MAQQSPHNCPKSTDSDANPRMLQAALRVTCKMSWTTGRSDLHARAGYEWCTTQPLITRHAGTATRRKT